MAEIELKDGAQLNAEAIDALKVFATEKEGMFVLDTSRLKSDVDVENVMRSKRNADAELKVAKQQLAEAQGKLKSYTEAFGAESDPGAIHAELEELRKGGGDLQKRLIAEVQNRKSWEKKYSDMQPEFERYKAAAEKEAAREISDRKDAIWAKKKAQLDAKWSKRKADVVFKNMKNEVRIADDDPEDFSVMADGRSVLEHMVEQLDLLDAYETVNGGRSKPGDGAPMSGGKKDMFEDAASQIKF